VKKSQLFQKLGLFRDSPALLGEFDYEVKSRVRPRHFEAFLDIVEGGPLVVSESTRKSFSLLAEEFGFDELSVACREFVTAGDTEISDEKSRSVEVAPVKRPRVSIISDYHFATYESFHSYDEIVAFTRDLVAAEEKDILIDGITADDLLVEKAVETLYSNTVADFADNRPKNPFLALTLWRLFRGLYSRDTNSCIYCLNLLDKMAPTAFDKARLLLLSQCDSGSYGDFIPLPTAEWEIIDDAIAMLRHERSGKTDEARQLLQKLSDTGRYDKLFDHWPWYKLLLIIPGQSNSKEHSIALRGAVYYIESILGTLF
jgi:hypothetical protein